MARMRTLKPAFFDDEDIADLSPWARLLFLGLWTLADRSGRVEERQQWIRARVFPYDDLEASRVRMADLFDELSKERKNRPGGFVVRYEVDGRRYLQIRNFEKHQKFHPDEKRSELPVPPPVTEKPRNPTASREIPRPKRRNNLPANPVLEPELERTTEGAGAPGKAPDWNREFAEDFKAVYKAPPQEQHFAQVKRIAKEYGWGKTRPALKSYMDRTAIEHLNIPKCVPVVILGGNSITTASALARAGPQARPPTTAGEKSVAAAQRYLERRSSGGEG